MIETNERRQDGKRASNVPLGVPSMTRRRLLSSTGQIAFLALLPAACTPVATTPWADGTYWADGQGWTD